jgi:hypothetical protein
MRKFAVLTASLLLTPPALGQQSDPLDELSADTQIKVQARRLFEQKKFQDLNAIEERFRASDAKTPAGFDKLALF